MNVLTLVHGRQAHLANLIRSLEASTCMPEAFVIVHMNEAAAVWTSPYFPIVQACLRTADGQLPLAAARNLAARHATDDELVFLDVDCIASSDLLDTYRTLLRKQKQVLYQGEVLYLPDGSDISKKNDADLDRLGNVHPLHKGRCPDERIPHALFWSLNFACQRDVFLRIGGFDTLYVGYGGEDTDFAVRAAKTDIPIVFAGARAYHQYHPVCEPPLNHLASIVRNSRLFHARWGEWPMEGWLRQFAEAGYIQTDCSTITLLRLPTHDEIAAATK
jgi:GT2 family glycosyltransferase